MKDKDGNGRMSDPEHLSGGECEPTSHKDSIPDGTLDAQVGLWARNSKRLTSGHLAASPPSSNSIFFQNSCWCEFYQQLPSSLLLWPTLAIILSIWSWWKSMLFSTLPSPLLSYFFLIILRWCNCYRNNLSLKLNHALVNSVQSLSHVLNCNPMDCSMPGFPVHHQLLELAQTHVHQVGDAINRLILCCPLPLPPSIFPSIRVFPNESVLWIRWPKYWSFSFNISPSNEHPGLVLFRIDWLDLLAVQGTLKSLLQHHSSETSILQHSAFFIGQLSHPYMTTGKTDEPFLAK